MQSCKNNSSESNQILKNEEIKENILKNENAEEWLKNIFKCKNESRYCFYIEYEKQLCTQRFYDFMIDSEEIYGASNLTGDDYLNALKEYKKKWKSIYPLRNEIYGQTWLFGRGNDDTEKIEKVEITKISDLKYSVFIDYGDNIKTQSEVLLVLENDKYKIDYCVTEFIEDTTLDESELIYPKTGNKASNFLPNNNIYEIQYETEGDLNKDGLKDIAIVLKHKESNIADRPMLILLQNKDKSYRLDKLSNLAMPIEYAENYYKIYDTEDISINNGELNIQLYGIGSSGNFLSTFKYINNELILTYIETYNAGAGSWQNLYFDLIKGELTQVTTNTMEEDMPSAEKSIKFSKKIHEFENTSPNQIIIEAYKKLEIE